MIKFNIKYLCDNDEKRKKGLMNKSLEDNQCAFFIFPNRGCHGFWNKNVKYDLSIIFLNDNFKIEDIKEMEAFSENPVYPESRYIKYAIEVKKGILEKNKVKEGDHIDFDPDYGVLVIKQARK